MPGLGHCWLFCAGKTHTSTPRRPIEWKHPDPPALRSPTHSGTCGGNPASTSPGPLPCRPFWRKTSHAAACAITRVSSAVGTREGGVLRVRE